MDDLCPLPDPHIIDGDQHERAAVAIILRKERPDAPWAALFIKRAANPTDRWSGHVAFPGGRRAPADVSVYDTAVRETQEEVGLALADATCFAPLGRLDDVQVAAGRRGAAKLVVSCFVFALRPGCATPALQLAAREVADFAWVPLAALAQRLRSAQAPRVVDMASRAGERAITALAAWDVALLRAPSQLFFPAIGGRVRSLLGMRHVYFPGLALPGAQRGEPMFVWGMTLFLAADLVAALRLGRAPDVRVRIVGKPLAQALLRSWLAPYREWDASLVRALCPGATWAGAWLLAGGVAAAAAGGAVLALAQRSRL